MNHELSAVGPATVTDFAAGCAALYDEVLRLASRWALCKDDAVDIAQETMVRALAKQSQFEAGTNLRAWLMRIAFHTFVNEYRRRQRARRAVEHAAQAINEMLPPALALSSEQQVLARALGEALESLDDRYRQVFVRAELDERAYREIADELHIPIGTVMSRLSRARAALRRKLEPHYRALAA